MATPTNCRDLVNIGIGLKGVQVFVKELKLRRNFTALPRDFADHVAAKSMSESHSTVQERSKRFAVLPLCSKPNRDDLIALSVCARMSRNSSSAAFTLYVFGISFTS